MEQRWTPAASKMALPITKKSELARLLPIRRIRGNLSEGRVNCFEHSCGGVGLANESEDSDSLSMSDQLGRFVNGEKEYGSVGTEFANLLRGFEPGAARHAEVENHEIGVDLPHQGDGFFSVGGFGAGFDVAPEFEDLA